MAMVSSSILQPEASPLLENEITVLIAKVSFSQNGNA